MNKSKAYSEGVYKEYLAWFEEKTKTPAGLRELKESNAYAVRDREGKDLPVAPYPYALWYIMDANSGCDFEIMAERAKQIRRRNTYKIKEALKHVDGNPDKPLLDPTFIARAEATKQLREQSRIYAGGTKAGEDNVLALRKEYGDLLKLDKTPLERPVPSTPKRGWFKRVLEWFKGDDTAPTSAHDYFGGKNIEGADDPR